MAAGPGKRQSRNIVGKRVKKARQSSPPGLTQDQLSGKVASEGVQLDRVAIAKIETGIRCAFDFEVKALAAALKVDAGVFHLMLMHLSCSVLERYAVIAF